MIHTTACATIIPSCIPTTLHNTSYLGFILESIRQYVLQSNRTPRSRSVKTVWRLSKPPPSGHPIFRIQTLQLCSIHCPPPRVLRVIPLCEDPARVSSISFLIASPKRNIPSYNADIDQIRRLIG